MTKTTGYTTNRYVDAYGKTFDLLFQKNDQDDIEVYVRTTEDKPYEELEVWSGVFYDEYTEEQNLEREATIYVEDYFLDGYFSEELLTNL